MPDEVHSSLSPSGRHRWGACPGSVRLEAAFTEDKGGPAAQDGTRTHTLLEHLVGWEFIALAGVCGPLPMWNTTCEDEFGSFTVDADRSKRLAVAMDYVRDHVAEYGGTVLAEQRVYPDGLVGRADMHGTVDIQCTGKFLYLIADYKDGMNPVIAEGNPQLEQYAIGVLAGLDPDHYPRKFRLVIIQPNLALKGLPVISTWDVTPADLLAAAKVAMAQADATEAPDAPLVPGEAQCKYCKAKGTCPALAKQAMEGIGAMFSPVNLTGGIVPAERVLASSFTPVPSFLSPPAVYQPVTEAAEYAEHAADVAARQAITPDVMPAHAPDMAQVLAARDPHAMDNDQLRQLMEAAPLVNQLLEGVKKEVERRLHSGQSVPGFKLVNGNGSRAWALPEEEMVKKLVGMQIPKGALYKQTLVSPAQAEKLVWDKKGEPCSLSDRQKKSMEQEYIIKKPGAPVVASESDSRPAIVRDASPLFSPVAVPSFLSAPSTKPSFLQ
jgi:hypothetical protein